MATVYVYNNDTNAIEKYTREWSEAMPYNARRTLTVREFRGSSCSSYLWTDKAAMEAWNVTRAAYGKPIPVGYAFKRIWEGGHSGQSQHYAGLSFDVGQTLSAAQRDELRNTAIRAGVWTYVEPAYLTPTWVHFDKRFPVPACDAGYPLVKSGSKNTYVFVLQDALNALGYVTNGVDGIFGGNTKRAVQFFQRDYNLAADGIVGCKTWLALTREALGIGQTATTVYKCR